jgi:negative regulator of genetic competence, sporulation and motility
MTPEDTERYEFSAANADYNSPDTRRIFWRIIDEASATVGFDPKGDKILIQFYPSRDGGAELFVSKLEGLSKKNERTLSKSRDVTLLDSKRSVFGFKSFEELLQASRIIKDSKCIRSSELFYDESEGYFLEITARDECDGECVPMLTILLEFSNTVPKELIPYITEHYSKLTQGNAVEQLAKL